MNAWDFTVMWNNTCDKIARVHGLDKKHLQELEVVVLVHMKDGQDYSKIAILKTEWIEHSRQIVILAEDL